MNRVLILAAALAAVSCTKAAPPPSPPQFAAKAICRPQFHVGAQMLVAGTGWVLDTGKPGSKPLLISAMHLFGPDGGLDKAIPWNELPAQVPAVDCKSFTSDAVLEGGAAIAIPNAHALSREPLRDISAFALLSEPPVRLKLAASPVAVGDSIWLVAQLLKGAPPTQLLHHAIVVRTGADFIEYRYDNSALEIQATSGGPLVNAQGEVVGVNLGGRAKDGEVLGLGDSLDVVKSALADAGQ